MTAYVLPCIRSNDRYCFSGHRNMSRKKKISTPIVAMIDPTLKQNLAGQIC
jgi:hypothetical protein